MELNGLVGYPNPGPFALLRVTTFPSFPSFPSRRLQLSSFLIVRRHFGGDFRRRLSIPVELLPVGSSAVGDRVQVGGVFVQLRLGHDRPNPGQPAVALGARI